LNEDGRFGTTYTGQGGAAIATGLGLKGALTCEAAFPTRTPAPPNTLVVDADASVLGLQTQSAVGIGGTTEIAIVASEVLTPYNGYAWQVKWLDAGLDFVGSVENEEGHGGTLCATPGVVDETSRGAGVPPGEEWVGQGAGCVLLSGTTLFEGDLVRITVRCVSEGAWRIEMMTFEGDPVFGTMMMTLGGILLPVTIGTGVDINCNVAEVAASGPTGVTQASPPPFMPLPKGTPAPTRTATQPR
jgi:hypothetical protein